MIDVAVMLTNFQLFSQNQNLLKKYVEKFQSSKKIEGFLKILGDFQRFLQDNCHFGFQVAAK